MVCDVTMVPSTGPPVAYARVRPYTTCESLPSSVVQAIVAWVVDRSGDVTPVMIGGVTSVITGGATAPGEASDTISAADAARFRSRTSSSAPAKNGEAIPG